MDIRPLKTADFFKIAKILSKMGNKVLKELKEETSALQAGMLFLTTALEYAESDVMEWLADLAGKTKEEFAELDFDTPLLVIEKLVETEDIPSFFERVRGLINKYSPKQ